MSNLIDLSGQKFGKITVIERAADKVYSNGKHYTQWLCKCDCGNNLIVPTTNLNRNHTNSCGCDKNNRISKANSKHNLSSTRIYKIWAGIKKRCSNPNDKNYKDYGGRGIKICDRWLKFENFYKDMGQEYEKHVKKYGIKNTSIDRKNVNGDYEFKNCRWATKIEQANNTTQNRLLNFNGETLTMSQMARKYNLSQDVVESRINRYGWSIKKALTTPVLNSKRGEVSEV